MQLRDYQREAVDAVWRYFAHYSGNPLIAMPTGSGKSLVIASIVWEALQWFPQTRVMMLTHVKELIGQNFGKLTALWPSAPAGIFSAGLGRKEHWHPITFAGIASVYRSAEAFGFIDFVVVDEAHLVNAKTTAMYATFLTGLRVRNPKLKVIGLSATCYRSATGPLTESGIFTDVCFDLTNPSGFARLLQGGYIARLVARKTHEQLNVDAVAMGSDGDYNKRELQDAVDKSDVTDRAVRELVISAADRQRWLVFAAGIEHAEHVTAALQRYGVPAVAIHSGMKDETRQANYKAFETGQVRAAVSMNALTTGVDIPEIDAIGMLRPTKSAALWVQMLGRGTRPAPGKRDCIVFDFAGNTRRLGPIDDPVVPLPARLRRKGIVPRPAPVRCCPTCLAYVHASLRTCSECGAEFGQALNIQAHSDGLAVMQAEAPRVEAFAVDSISYDAHVKRSNNTTSMRVDYYSGLRRFTEFVCFEHVDMPRRKAVEWWLERTGERTAPATVKEAVQQSTRLRAPKRLRVWINRKHPEIVGHEYE